MKKPALFPGFSKSSARRNRKFTWNIFKRNRESLVLRTLQWYHKSTKKGGVFLVIS